MRARVLVPLLVLHAAAASGAAGQVPVPPRLPTPTIEAPELQILEVRRSRETDEAIRLNDVVPVEVVVRNTGNRRAIVRAGTPNDRSGRGGGLMRYGPARTVGPGETVSLPLELVATGNRFRGDRFETDVFLFNAAAPNDPPLGRIFSDRNREDNEFRVSLAFDRPRTYDVVGLLDYLTVFSNCDTASEGDWYVHFGLAEMRGDVLVQKAETYWPDRNQPSNVSNREVVRVDRLVRLTSVRADSEILLSVSAVDCDADSPLAWPISEPVAIARHGPEKGALSTGLFGAYWEFAAGCTGEEIWEASGGHDKAGSYFYRVPPDRWQANSDEALTNTAYEPHDCSDSPSITYRPTVRVEANER